MSIQRFHSRTRGLRDTHLPFHERRTWMVNEQIAARGVTDLAVLEAMREVPRHLFVPDEVVAEAYGDHPLPIGCGQTISQPYIVALMTHSIRPSPGCRVLDVGTGSGYQSAVLSRLCRAVFTVELIPELSCRAARALRKLGYDNVFPSIGDGSAPGFLKGEFDGIVVAAAAAEVPRGLLAKLADGGRMVIPVGERSLQSLLLIERQGDEFERTSLTGCVFVPLRPGATEDPRRQGWFS